MAHQSWKLRGSLFGMGAILLGVSCAGNPMRKSIDAPETQRSPARAAPVAPDSGAGSLPEIAKDNGQLTALIRKALKIPAKGAPVQDSLLEPIRHYLLFLGLTARDFQKSAALPAPAPKTEPVPGDDTDGEDDDDDDGTPSNLKAIQRIFASSTQFLYCPSFRDWECLEKAPPIAPRAAFRQSDENDLGSPSAAGKRLELESYFTQAWDGKTPHARVVDRLAEHLQTDVGKSLSLAVYGIDDISGSMKPVYDAILNHHMGRKVNVRALVDISGFEREGGPWEFSFAPPESSDPGSSKEWVFGKSSDGAGMHATFQYDGTPDLIRALNSGITKSEDSLLRTEWPTAHIMHNKFAVLEDASGHKSVWTGTANFSKHCLGEEVNANMSIYIKNDAVAQAYLDEFNEMFTIDPTLEVESKLVTPPPGEKSIKVGRFHHNKSPQTHRLFKFDDGNSVRVHFAPTDDAEHRVILPMLLSAHAGDEVRVSMFGGTGYEIVRAFQYAAARGAHVRIVFDRRLGHGATSWVRDSVANLTMKNPYLGLPGMPKNPGQIEVKMSTWAGKNHYKAGTLTRKQANGSRIVEQLIVGSQNWSSGGNDDNDENLVSIQNLVNGVEAGQLFNEEFDNHLWAVSAFEKK